MLFDQMDKDKNGTVDKPEFVAVASRDEQIVSSLASNISSVARVEQSAQEFTTFDQQVFFFFLLQKMSFMFSLGCRPQQGGHGHAFDWKHNHEAHERG